HHVFPADERFQEWFASLPNLDVRDQLKSQEEIENDREIGASPEERKRALRRGQRLEKGLKAFGFVTAAWTFVYPHPYRLVIAILTCLPWVALVIVARSGGLFRIDKLKTDAHPSVSGILLFPCFLLPLRSMLDFPVVDWKHAVLLACAIGSIL